MREAKAAIAAFAATVTLAGCASTRFNSTWKAPDAGPLDFAGRKVAALVVTADQATRLGAEAALARELTQRGVKGVPAHTILPAEEVKDKDKAKARLVQAGVEGAVVMRPVAKDQQITATGGTYWGQPMYGSFWGYYGWGWGAVYDPGYIRTDTVVTVETLIYDVKNDKLVWAGMSETTNPERVDTLIGDLVTEAAKQMRKQGLVRGK
jgi:hypothetical protein